VSPHPPEAAIEYTRGSEPVIGASGAHRRWRQGLVVAGVLGAFLLIVATFTTVIEIRVSGSRMPSGVDADLSGWDRHSISLILIALVAFVMLAGAAQDAWPAMAAVAALGLVALLITVLGDAPDIHETGEVGKVFESAVAGAGTGFYLETLGGALLLVAGGGLLMLRDWWAPGAAAAVDDGDAE
jgi:hypothetical protein